MDLTAYEEGFKFIFSNDDIRNIAISGPYSSGKSSLLESYKEKHPEKKFIHISLAHFSSENKDVEAKESEDNETIIEGKILNQLIQQIPVENIPQSNFRIKRTAELSHNWYWAIGIVAFIGMLIFVMNYGEYYNWVSEVNPDAWKYSWLKHFMLFLATPLGGIFCELFIVVIACVGLYHLLNIQTNKNIFKRISVQGNEIEIFEDSQSSYFDKYLNEVLYLFENSKADVIVFEDIDRFENVQIFERLREINMLINCRLRQRDAEGDGVRFFYLLRDDIFITKDRTKFFDYILPVIPVLDSSNSYNKIKEFFSESTVADELDDRFLKGLALYIDDLRVLKNIYNEYVIYYERLKKIDLDPNRMLALITYKNLFPKDFADLQLNKGFVHAIFASKDKIFNEETSRLDAQIQKIKERINNSQTELAISLEELEDIREAKYKKAESDRAEFRRFREWESGEYLDRVESIKAREAEVKQSLNEQVEQLRTQKTRMVGWPISQIINHGNIDEVFKIKTRNELGEENDYGEIKQSEYFNLLKYLIRNGYINESYRDYMTYFYENSLTLNDKMYLRAVNDKKAREYSYRLDSPFLIVSDLIPADFLQEETLNFDLLEYMLDNESETSMECFKNMAIQIREKRKFDFVSQYFALNRKRPEFVCWLNEKWTNYFILAYCRKELSKDLLFEYSLYSVMYCSKNVVTAMNEQRMFSEFISEQSNFLLVSENRTNQMIENPIHLDVKFKSINPKSDESLLMEIYENNLYVINYANLRLFLSFAYHLDWNLVWCHIMTSIMSNRNQALCKYVNNSLNDTIETINSISTKGIDDNEETIFYILNSDKVELETKSKYISLLRIVLHDLSKVKDNCCRDALLRKRLVKESVENIYEYFSKQSLTDVLVSFINGISNELNFSIITYDEDIVEKFVECIQFNNEILDVHYKSILSAKGKMVINFKEQGLDESKVRILIDENKLQMNLSNLLHLRQYYPDCVFYFIQENLDEYCKIMTHEYAQIDEIEKILRWNILKDDDAIHLMDLLQTNLNVLGQGYNDRIIVYILDHYFSEIEFIPLLEKFSAYSEMIQCAILRLSDSKSRMNKVADSIYNIDFNVLKVILSSDNIQDVNKIILLRAIIKNGERDLVKEALAIAGYKELSKLLDCNARPRILANSKNEQLMKVLKESQYIASYEFNEKSGIYSYTRSTKKRNSL